MGAQMNRRQFLATSAMAAAGAAGILGGRLEAAPKFRTTLKRALIVGEPTRENLQAIKDAGFDGVEAGIVTPEKAAEARKIAEEMGLRIHSVIRGWAQFNSDNQQEVESGLQVTIDALKAAQAYGADAVLLVPGRMDVNPMPEPWEFRVKFDRKTGHITQVVEGDNARYQAYIDAHNRAYDAFQVAVRRLIPVARETRVVIALENVWNNLFVDPAHFAFFVNSFKNRWVKAYLDLGNHVKYAPTEQWVAALGKSIAKCHVKDFKLNPDGRGGNFCEIRDGSVDWPVVRKALDRVGYSDWMTIEGGSLPFDEQRRRLDLIIAGQ
ncbi:MAG: sugar phosphate isomerase/epimerase [Armatimonadetes bacterium]|jgi:L-ribulose-5-phosphate 3-epimerase|nr:sugar phosphate isomerase/epimerase [Armatimonadota bacterium]